CAAHGRQALDRIPGQRLLGVRESGLTRSRRLARRRADSQARIRLQLASADASWRPPMARHMHVFCFTPPKTTTETPSK
ncbi:hypothetical protein ACMZ49_23770, partial [Alcaligenes phenolicus]